MAYRIGYAQDIITPRLDRPVFLAGFEQNRRAETIHDDLYARTLVISNHQTTLILIALDLIGFFRPDALEVISRIKSDTLPLVGRADIIIASTHTHHGPDTMGLWGPNYSTRGVDSFYLSLLKAKIAGIVRKALESLRPAEGIKSASVHVQGVAKNARDPKIIDDELTVTQFMDTNGKPLASLYNFPCHPEVLWQGNPHITADYPGYLRREVEERTGAPCIFFSGALGGMMTPDVKEHSFEEAEEMGKKLACEGLLALESACSQTLEMLELKKIEFKVKMTNILFNYAYWRKILPDTRDRLGRITTEVNLLKIGELWLATVPGELLPKLGLQLKAHLIGAGARVGGVVGLANDELGYIIPPEDFKYPLNPFNPKDHYEETVSIGKGIGPKLIESVLQMLAR